MGDPENATVSLDWKLFEKQLLQEDGSIVIVFKNEENGKDPQEIHIRYAFTKLFFSKKVFPPAGVFHYIYSHGKNGK